ncbi:2-hydroxyacid dehydrogenase [Cognatishimia maritima]|uniref:Hydroxypyruvate reductase n=1 Tax=Cognatishimia maritima TaxID=870908 RepID=A0A1M5KXE5_9RHOB|nr:D-glycerate dehydrogenase [Cognatishimia maritima]SHG57468.1 hydroxypyruvate reductase [Cognatishimia maritima]
MKSLLITRPLPDPVIAAAQELFAVTVRQDKSKMSADEMRASLRDFDAVLPTLGDHYSAEIFADVPNPRAKVLANFGVGYNHIDVEAAHAAGLQVSNTPGAVTDATADIALMLMLMTCRRAGEGERLVRRGEWRGWHPIQFLSLHMTGKTLGIVGMGRIGQAIAKRAHFGFDMTIKYVNRSTKEMDFPAEQVATLTELAGQVDVLVVALPGGEETYHLINAEVFSAMQPHAILINIARGEIVDEAALITALQQGEIGGAGLDVYENEPDVPLELIALENVTLLPHLGTAALEVRTDMGLMAVENLRAFAAGEPLPNGV